MAAPTPGAGPPCADSVCIRVLETNLVVSVPVSELADDAMPVLEVMEAEAAPLESWVQCAKAYLAQGREAAFVQLCSEGIKEEVSVEVERYFGRKPTYEQVQFHCALAALHMARARDAKDKQAKSEHLGAAAKSLTAARMLDNNEQLVTLGLGMLALAKVMGLTRGGAGPPCAVAHARRHAAARHACARTARGPWRAPHHALPAPHHHAQGDVSAARHEFTRSTEQLNNGRPNIAGHLALAGLLFNAKQYKEALKQ